MRSTAFFLACVGILLGGIASATAQPNNNKKLKEGEDFAPDFQADDWVFPSAAESEVPSLKELRGTVVVVFFWVSRHEGGKFILPYMNLLDASDTFGRKGGIVMIGLTDADRKRTDEMVKENKITFPVGTSSKSAQEWEIDGEFGLAIVDTEGKLAYRGSGVDLQGMQSKLAEIISKGPPTRAHPIEARLARQDIAEARTLIGGGKFKDAYFLAGRAADRSVFGDPITSDALELTDLIERMAQERVAQVQPLLDKKNFKEAANVLRHVVRDFRGSATQREARKWMADLEKENDEFKKAMSSFQGEGTAAKLVYDAREELRAKRIGEAYRKLSRTVTDYPDTEAADVAREMIDRMKKNENMWGFVLDDQAAGEAPRLLAQARNLIKERKYAEAKKILERVRKDFSGTVYDDEARDELIKMP